MSATNESKPNKKAIKRMSKLLNQRKKKDELEGLDDVIFDDDKQAGEVAKKEIEKQADISAPEKTIPSDEVAAQETNGDDNAEGAIEHPSEDEEEDTQAAWQDDDDKNVKVDLRSEARLRKLRVSETDGVVSGVEYQKRLKGFYNSRLQHSTFYSWAYDTENNAATMDQAEEDNLFDTQPEKILDNILRTSYALHAPDYSEKHAAVQGEVIDIERIGQSPVKTKHQAVVQTLQFHSNSTLYFSAGLDKLIKIYTIRENRPAFRDNVKLLKQIFTDNMPITQAAFVPQQDQIVAAGLRKHLLLYDLRNDKIEKLSSHLFAQRFDNKIEKLAVSQDGKYIGIASEAGYILILNGKTKQFLFELKLNEHCADISFSYDSKYIFAVGKQGKLYQYDLAKRAIFDLKTDQGALSATALKVSPTGEYVSTASSSGIVNIYSYEKSTNALSKEPIKEVLNLTTSVDTLAFNSQSEILLTASKWKKNAVRLLHMPSLTVYQNWPNFKTQLKFVTAAAFSDNGKYLAIGNDAGSTYLYNFKHYS